MTQLSYRIRTAKQWNLYDFGLIRYGISLGMTLFHQVIDSAIVFLLRDVARYRLKVIRNNLQKAFHYENEEELSADVKLFYKYLARIIRQVITVPSAKHLHNRLSINNLNIVNQWLDTGKSIIICMGHVGNWEWAGIYLGLRNPGNVCALYKKIKSKAVNQMMVRRRSKFKGHLVENNNIIELVRLIRKQPVLILMIADQNPGNDQGIIWANFFNTNTAFVNGPENLSRKYQLPVLYLHNHPNKNEGYDLELEVLWDGERIMENGEITKRFATALEKNIRNHRTEWLWSHKRWKRNPEFNRYY